MSIKTAQDHAKDLIAIVSIQGQGKFSGHDFRRELKTRGTECLEIKITDPEIETTILHEAARAGNVEIVEYLAEEDSGQNLLITDGNNETVMHLLGKSENPSAPYLILHLTRIAPALLVQVDCLNETPEDDARQNI